MEIIDEITNNELWLEYLEFKTNQNSYTKRELEDLKSYIYEKKYINIANSIKDEKYTFSVPEKRLINKIDKSKKRVVYSYNYDEMMILKLISYLFSKKYDNLYPSNCYSFRKSYGVKNAINKIIKNKKIHSLYGYKIDISNYFNSANVDILIKKFSLFAPNEKKLYKLLCSILYNKNVKFKDNIITEDKGMMAGIPVSSFLANIYLKDIDEYFLKNNIEYLRYSDDIILFTDLDNFEFYSNKLNELLSLNKLSLNPKKVKVINPGSEIEFLGFSIKNNEIDISNVTKKKIKGKIKRSSRKLRRWMLKNNADYTRAIAAVIRKFNRKFYMVDNTKELTWALWYFPIITTDKSLKEIDNYFQNTLRFIKTGKYNKLNYNIKYSELKKLGYRSLVNEYYKTKNMYYLK